MSHLPNFSNSVWFATLVALLVALGSQVLIEALAPITAFDWLFNESRRQAPIVMTVGESFWREESVVRAIAFGIGAFIGCILARSHSWQLQLSLIAISLCAITLVQLPRPASMWQLAVWVSSAPAATIVVVVLFRAWKGDAYSPC